MGCSESDFSMVRGDDVTVQVTAKDAGTSAILVITGSAITVTVFNTNGEEIFSRSTASGGVTIVNGATGRFNFTIPKALSEDLLGEYFFEAQGTDSSGNRFTLRRQNLTSPILTSVGDRIT